MALMGLYGLDGLDGLHGNVSSARRLPSSILYTRSVCVFQFLPCVPPFISSIQCSFKEARLDHLACIVTFLLVQA